LYEALIVQNGGKLRAASYLWLFTLRNFKPLSEIVTKATKFQGDPGGLERLYAVGAKGEEFVVLDFRSPCTTPVWSFRQRDHRGELVKIAGNFDEYLAQLPFDDDDDI